MNLILAIPVSLLMPYSIIFLMIFPTLEAYTL